VALVSRDDDVHVEVLGRQSFDGDVPMKRVTIFRIASITKPVTAIAAMILIEECRMRLDDAIERWLPELGNRRVLKSISAELDDTVPAARALTARDYSHQRIGVETLFGTHSSWDFGLAVDTARREIYRNPGRFGCTGGFGHCVRRSE
jgi:CubicO group peptidase (beta-lactamase class C family)